MIGKIHSLQSLGTVDGPGVRFVVFLSGCNLRCKCCHNPDTWDMSNGKDYEASYILEKVLRCKEYFKHDGGITVSGGEPLLQSAFVTELFTLCKRQGINTCLDTSGNILNDEVEKLLKVTDRVLLDIKYTDETLYQQNVGCSYEAVLEFLNILNKMNIPTTIRQVIIPSLNDNKENINRLNSLFKNNKCVDKIELLPFKKICQVKYDNMKLDFPFKNIPEPTKEQIEILNKLIIKKPTE